MIWMETMIKVLCYTAIALAIVGLLQRWMTTTTENEHDRQA